MREITEHQINSLNKALKVVADDRAEETGGSHQYEIMAETEHTGTMIGGINFQRGPVSEVGINGITNEVLLAIVIDRLRGWQSGPFTCRENALALTKLEEGLMWLQARTRDRIARGVEDTYQK